MSSLGPMKKCTDYPSTFLCIHAMDDFRANIMVDKLLIAWISAERGALLGLLHCYVHVLHSRLKVRGVWNKVVRHES